MDYTMKISEEENLVIVSPRGSYSYKEVIALIDLVIHDPLFKSTLNFIIDIRKIDYTPVVSEIYVISRYFIDSKKYFKGKTAIITRGEVLYSMFKLATLFVKKEGLKSNIFKTRDDALQWINSSSPDKNPV